MGASESETNDMMVGFLLLGIDEKLQAWRRARGKSQKIELLLLSQESRNLAKIRTAAWAGNRT